MVAFSSSFASTVMVYVDALLVIKYYCSAERTVGVEREERVIIFPIYKVVSDRPTLWIDGIKFTHDGTDWLVLGYC